MNVVLLDLKTQNEEERTATFQHVHLAELTQSISMRNAIDTTLVFMRFWFSAGIYRSIVQKSSLHTRGLVVAETFNSSSSEFMRRKHQQFPPSGAKQPCANYLSATEICERPQSWLHKKTFKRNSPSRTKRASFYSVSIWERVCVWTTQR